jgi:FkbM family methyltransferase
MQEICEKTGIKFNENKIVIPSWVKHIKLDIGLGRHPIYSHNWLRTQPDTIVFGFEPNPAALACIHKNLHTSGNVMATKFFPIPVALSSQSSELTFYVTEPWYESSSLLKPKESTLSMIKSNIVTIKVPGFKLSEFFELLPLESVEYIEYIKIDAQGVDLDIVKSGKDVIQDKVVYITLEADGHYYENSDSNVSEIDTYMESIGFLKVAHPNVLDPTYLNKKFQDIADSIYICQKT